MTELERLQVALAEIVRLYDKGQLLDVTIERPAEPDSLSPPEFHLWRAGRYVTVTLRFALEPEDALW